MAKRVKYVSLSNDLMGKYILGCQERIKYTIDFLTSLLGMASKEFKDAKVLNSVKLTKEKIKQKNFELDIVLQTKDGTIYNIEIQSVDSKNSRLKNTMYIMRIFGGKLKSGEDYDKSKPVLQIVIMNDKDYKNRNNKLIQEMLVSCKYVDTNYIDEYFKIFIIDINCEVDYTKIDKRLLGWILLFRANTYKEAYECIKYNEILEEVIRDMKEYASEDYVQDYSIKEKLHRSEINSAKEAGIELGRNEGIELGRNEGIELGRSEGIDYANAIMAQRLRDIDMDPNQIVEITGIPLNKVLSLKKRNEVSMVSKEKAKYNEYTNV